MNILDRVEIRKLPLRANFKLEDYVHSPYWYVLNKQSEQVLIKKLGSQEIWVVTPDTRVFRIHRG